MADTLPNEMSKLSVAPSKVAKKAAGSIGRPLKVATNLRELALQPNVPYFKYDFRVYAVFLRPDGDGKEGRKEITKQSKQDYTEQTRKTLCADVFVKLANTSPVFKGDLIYDRAAILFAMKQLKDIGSDATAFRIEIPKLGSYAQEKLKEASFVEILVKRAADSFQCSTSDLASACNAEFKGGDRALYEVLNIGTSQEVFFKPTEFVTYGNGNIYFYNPPRDFQVADIGSDKYLGVGLSKGIRIAEGEGSNAGKPIYSPMIVVDVKKTAFHVDDQPLVDKMRSMFRGCNPQFFASQNQRVSRELANLQVITTYGKKERVITIGHITKSVARDLTFKDDKGQNIKIVDYFKKKYGVTVDGSFPCVVDKYDSRILIPASQLKVAPSQRVKKDQGGPQMAEQMIRACATLPTVRQEQTDVVANALNLNSNRIKALGILLKTPNALQVNGRQMPPVKINYKNGVKNGPSWDTGAYAVPASKAQWAIISTEARLAELRFVDNLISAGRTAGVAIEQPVFQEAGVTLASMEQFFIRAKEMKLRILVIVSSIPGDHARIKELEQKHGVTTQEVKVESCRKGPQTMQNICHKFNEKIGGVNIYVTPTDKIAAEVLKKALIIGLTVQHPQAMTAKDIEAGKKPTRPAIISWAANNSVTVAVAPEKKNEILGSHFSGNFKYANPRGIENNGEVLEVTLKKCIIEALQQFLKTRGYPPLTVIIYRGGISEGQFYQVATAERDIFRAAFKALNEKYSPGLAIVAVSRDHNERLYRADKPKGGRAKEQNLPPGTLVDSRIVNPEFNEFYLLSQQALQGTAKPAKYTLLCEDKQMPMDAWEDLTNSLTHLHQIVNSPTSLPSPLYIANQYNKRASEQFTHRSHNSHSSTDGAGINIEQLNSEFTYGDNHPLKGLRFNA